VASRIEIKRSAQKEIRSLASKKDRRRIVERITALAEDPRPPDCRKLAGQEAYRLRQGDYRIIYTIQDDVLIVEVVKVAHRRNAYR
jgi:mRNA interferase RelE/StbE